MGLHVTHKDKPGAFKTRAKLIFWMVVIPLAYIPACLWYGAKECGNPFSGMSRKWGKIKD